MTADDLPPVPATPDEAMLQIIRQTFLQMQDILRSWELYFEAFEAHRDREAS